MNLCNKHREEKGFAAQTLRTATFAVKCDFCDETKGVMSSDEWKLAVNAAGIKRAKAL